MILTPFKFKSTPSHWQNVLLVQLIVLRFLFSLFLSSLLSHAACDMRCSKKEIEFVVVVIHNDQLLVERGIEFDESLY